MREGEENFKSASSGLLISNCDYDKKHKGITGINTTFFQTPEVVSTSGKLELKHKVRLKSPLRHYC